MEQKRRKSVTFTEKGAEEVFYVDDWDRSPAAVTERLTYKYVHCIIRQLAHALTSNESLIRDVYELKELRISLPRINVAANRTKLKPKCVV